MVERGVNTGKTAVDLAKGSADFLERIWQKLNIGDPIVTTVTYLYPKSKMKTTRLYNLPVGRRSMLKTKINLPAGRNLGLRIFMILNQALITPLYLFKMILYLGM